jgi:hypothetical protein
MGERLAGGALAGNRQGCGLKHRFDLNFLCLLSLFQDKESMWGSGQCPGYRNNLFLIF